MDRTPTAKSRTAPRAGQEGSWVVPLLFAVGVVLTLAHRLSADEGQVLSGAWNLYNGQRIYQDFFEFIGPASFSWVHLFYEGLTPTYGSALVASQLLLLVSIWAVHRTARLLIPDPRVCLAVSVVWILLATTPPFINHNSYGSFLATVFAYLLLSVDERRGGGSAAAAGAVAALTFFFLQPKGAVLLAVGVVALTWRSWFGRPRRPMDPVTEVWGGREAGALLLRFGAGALPLGLWGFWRWGFEPVSAVLTVARGNIAINHLFLSYWPLLAFVTVATLVGVACYKEGLWDGATAVLLLLQAALWGSTLHLPDSWHLSINAFPLVLLLGRLAAGSLERIPSPAWHRALASLFGLALLLGLTRIVTRNAADSRVAEEWIEEIASTLNGQEFYAFTLLPSFYLELRTPNPFYNSVLYTGSHPIQHFERNVEILAARRTPYVLADYAMVERYGHSLDNPVDVYLRRHYRLSRSIRHETGVFEVWEIIPR
jgi:hypothetical protein